MFMLGTSNFTGYRSNARCPFCNRTFPITTEEDWGYRIGNKLYCGWPCKQAAERKMKEDAEARRRAHKRGYNSQVERRRKLIEMYDAGFSRSEILKETGYSESGYYVIINNREELVKNGYTYKQNKGRSFELGPEDKEKILQLHAEGLPTPQIAKAVGRSTTSVYRVLHKNGIWTFPNRMRFNTDEEDTE